jgi:hypothetical protein
MKTIALATVAALATTLLSVPALADEPKTNPATVAPPPDKPTLPDVVERPGVTFRFNGGFMVPTGNFAEGTESITKYFGPGAALTLLLGYYVTPHFGVLGGVQASYGHTGHCENRSSDGCIGYTLQVPVVAEYAFRNRQRGVVVLAGLGLLTQYRGIAGADSISFTNGLAEAKLGLAYRFVLTPAEQQTSRGLEINLTTDIGRFSAADLEIRGRRVSGDITKPAVHATFLLTVGATFN